MCGPCGVCCVACVHKYVFSRFFFACDGGGAVDRPQCVHVLLFAAVSSIFHMLSNANMWKRA